ncbi:Vasohibin-2 [Hondaea fermentalgiana]|uniref:Vasohibin-2 n=1 Tax=Hondaea fermentalgiana TaxID=2315210 RepID=A0A2R5GSD1_9STRA|nr:Vasohibin-2 [Hondaea fermentalgiana]|eukprot:GBG30784.1 Vasohibin-2 [Hondaea fermentalgiana]
MATANADFAAHGLCEAQPGTEEPSSREEHGDRELKSNTGANDHGSLSKNTGVPNSGPLGKSPSSKAALAKAIKALEEKDPDTLPEVPRPRAPTNFAPAASAAWRLERIQQYISRLEYNHTGTNYFTIRKDRGAKRLAGTAREIMRECLPIKCIEAVFLGFYLTLGMNDLVRIPLRFQSSVEQNGQFVFKHIVMAVGHKGRWGAIGLSRKETLMHRKIQFDSLAELIKDFCGAYGDLGHSVQHVGVGLPFGHCEHSMEPIHWRPLMIEFDGAARQWSEATEQAINTFVNRLEVIEPYVLAHGGELPTWFLDQHPTVKRPSGSVEGGSKSKKKSSKTKQLAKSGSKRSSLAEQSIASSDEQQEEGKKIDLEGASEEDGMEEERKEEDEADEDSNKNENNKEDSEASNEKDLNTAHLATMTAEDFLQAREPAPPSLEIPALGLMAVSIPRLEDLTL